MTLVRDLLLDRTLLLFFVFYLLGSMAGSGVQAWLITILHEVKGVELALASTALTAYMLGTAAGVLVGGWAVNRLKHRIADVRRLPHRVLRGVDLFGRRPARHRHRRHRDHVPLGPRPSAAAERRATSCSRTPTPRGEIGKVFGFVSSGLPLGSGADAGAFRLSDRSRPCRVGAGSRRRDSRREHPVHGDRPRLGQKRRRRGRDRRRVVFLTAPARSCRNGRWRAYALAPPRPRRA